MNNADEWVAQLREVYETDKARQQAKETSSADSEPVLTSELLLQQCKAHELMRQVQKTLLDGRGKLQFYEDVGGYDRAIVLMWVGTISDASEPASIEEVDASIIVGANGEGIFVNDTRLSEATPGALRQALLDVAQGFLTEKTT